jgi:cytochrome c oxidase cbb3-type subunit 3
MTGWRLFIALAVVVLAIGGAAFWLINISAQPQNRVGVSYPEGVAAAVPLGLSPAGGPKLNFDTDNPLRDDPNSVEEGKKLFASMNCAGCHGYTAKGGMGPDLTDKAWRYGGTPIEVYKSIYEGRPQGMPAWGSTLPTNPIWQLVAYIQSLGGTFAPLPPDSQQQIASDQGLGPQSGQHK